MSTYLESVPHPENLASTLVELLHWRALRQGQTSAYVFLNGNVGEDVEYTYADMDQHARRIGAFLQSQGLTGERVVLLFPPGLEYIATFFGCLYAGVIAVPVYPPPPNRPPIRLESIVIAAQARVVLTMASVATPSYLERLFAYSPALSSLLWLTIDSLPKQEENAHSFPIVTGETLAFLQYTSGSTSTPRGVIITHNNLLHNLSLIHYGFQLNKTDKVLSWLPLYHDMGLIGGILEPLYTGCPCILMAPTAFLQRPLRWLQAITRHRATISGAPNFAYQLCYDKITPEQCSSLDLSSWRVAFCGSETVRIDTLERFAQKFTPYGFSLEAFYPCYGLAEATLFVTGGLGPARPEVATVRRDALTEGRVVPAAAEDANAQTFVSCGSALLPQRVVIVQPETRTACNFDQVGEVWVAGESVAQGYWNNKEATMHTFQAYLAEGQQGPFLRTGDLGFLLDDKLYIVGRIKDLIIIWGRNYYPQDIELTVERSHPALRHGCGATFTVEVVGSEQLVITQEVERTYLNNDLEEITGAIRQVVTEHHELPVHTIVLLKPGSIPKTSSGKIQRYRCREAFLDGSLNSL